MRYVYDLTNCCSQTSQQCESYIPFRIEKQIRLFICSFFGRRFWHDNFVSRSTDLQLVAPKRTPGFWFFQLPCLLIPIKMSLPARLLGTLEYVRPLVMVHWSRASSTGCWQCTRGQFCLKQVQIPGFNHFDKFFPPRLESVNKDWFLIV